MSRLNLIAYDGDLYTPESAIVCEELRKHYNGDVRCILLHRYSDGDVDTIAWPSPNEEQLRSCLYDLRETGMIPSDTKSAELPDGSIFEIEKPAARTELLAAMQSAGRLIVGHIGDRPKANKNDKPGSPQTVVTLERRNGTKTSVYVCEGADAKSFRIVLDDVIHFIPDGMTLEQAVQRQQHRHTMKLWPDSPEWWFRAPTVQGIVSQEEGAQ